MINARTSFSSFCLHYFKFMHEIINGNFTRLKSLILLVCQDVMFFFIFEIINCIFIIEDLKNPFAKNCLTFQEKNRRNYSCLDSSRTYIRFLLTLQVPDDALLSSLRCFHATFFILFKSCTQLLTSFLLLLESCRNFNFCLLRIELCINTTHTTYYKYYAKNSAVIL